MADRPQHRTGVPKTARRAMPALGGQVRRFDNGCGILGHSPARPIRESFRHTSNMLIITYCYNWI